MNIELEPLRGKRLLCAVSGGADSMCLMHLLHSAGLDIVCAHYEHGIRGEESLRDMAFVKGFCESHCIPFVSERGDVPAYARAHGLSMEEAARKLRYEFLERSRESLGCQHILTAHNLNDNAETILFNLARGSGTAGMAGIPRQRGHILRPLLSVPRSEIEDYLAAHKLPHVEDSTNQSDDYTRNLIRHRILPLMEGINPRFIEAAGRASSLALRDEDCLRAMAEDYIRQHLQDGSLPLDSFNALPEAISSRVLRKLLQGLGMEHVDGLIRFCKAPGYAEIDLPGRRLVRDGGRLWLDVPALQRLEDRAVVLGQPLLLPELGLRMHCEICDYMGEVNDLFKTSYIKYEIIESTLLLGSRRDGDRLRPAGRGCSKSLKSLFVERHWPRHKRESCPVLRDGKGLLWVRGLALDERAVPQVGEKALKIVFEKINIDTGE